MLSFLSSIRKRLFYYYTCRKPRNRNDGLYSMHEPGYLRPEHDEIRFRQPGPDIQYEVKDSEKSDESQIRPIFIHIARRHAPYGKLKETLTSVSRPCTLSRGSCYRRSWPLRLIPCWRNRRRGTDSAMVTLRVRSEKRGLPHSRRNRLRWRYPAETCGRRSREDRRNRIRPNRPW